MPGSRPSLLLQGTLDLLVLRALVDGPRHGYGVMRFLRIASGEELLVEEGALYPALHRLEERGSIHATWGVSENNRRAKFYRLTPQGSAQLAAETHSWQCYVDLVHRVLAPSAPVTTPSLGEA